MSAHGRKEKEENVKAKEKKKGVRGANTKSSSLVLVTFQLTDSIKSFSKSEGGEKKPPVKGY